jgi:ribosomal silencing factor RsfS
MLDRAVFVIVMSWTSTTYDSMIMCDTRSTRNAKSILFSFDYFEYTTNFFVGVDN